MSFNRVYSENFRKARRKNKLSILACTFCAIIEHFILSSCLRKYRCPDNPVNSGLKRKQLPKGKEWRGAIQRPSHFLDALFDKAENHITVVKALASKWKGLTRKEIVAATGLSNSGSLTRILEELEKSSFIQTYYPLGKKKKGSL